MAKLRAGLEVSCLALTFFYDYLKGHGIPRSRIQEGLPYSPEYLEDRVNWLDYATFLEIERRMGALFPDDPQLFFHIGRNLGATKGLAFIKVLVRALTSAALVYRRLPSMVPRFLFPFLTIEVETESAERVGLHYRFAEDYPPSEAFLQTVRGGLTAVPEMVGAPPATVVLERRSAHHAHFSVAVHKWGGLPRTLREIAARLRAILRISWRGLGEAATELAETNQRLLGTVAELLEARDELDIRVRGLSLLNEVARAASSELDLRRLLRRVANVLSERLGDVPAAVILAEGEPPRPVVAATAAVDAAHLEHLRDFTAPRNEPPPCLVVGERVATLPVGPDRWTVAPLTLHGQPVGAVAVRAGLEVQVEPEVFEALARQLAVAIDNARSYQVISDLRDHLEVRVRERTAELEEARGKLEDTVVRLERSDRARREFFTNVSHELKTPLTLILGPLDDLQQELQARRADSLVDSVCLARRNGRGLLRQVNAILDSARLDSGKVPLVERQVDLRRFLEDIVETLRPLADRREIALGYEATAAPIWVSVDPKLLRRALVNLISNAIKYIDRGDTISVRLATDGEGVSLEVQDSGPGIPADQQERIFERFQRAADARGRVVDGSGVGLAMVREIAALHRGAVELDSEPGDGATFRLRLPGSVLVEEPTARGETDEPTSTDELAAYLEDSSGVDEFLADAGAAGARGPGGPVARVLLVEDNPEMRAFIGRILRREHDLLLARDGREGLDTARAEAPDLVVSDVMMPRMDGYELCRRLKEDPVTRGMPVVLVSAKHGTEATLEGFAAGADDYVVKPFSPPELLARLRAQLHIRQLTLALLRAEKQSAVGILAAGIAHEVRNPLNAMVNAVPPLRPLLAVDGAEGPGGRLGTQLLGIIESSGERIGHVVDGLLAFSRTDTEEVRPLDGADLAARIDTVLALLAHRLGDGVAVERTDGWQDSVSCRPELVSQLVMILVANAVDALEEAGGTVELTTEQRAGRLCLRVADDGPGIPPEQRERVFTPFFTTKDPGKGTGMGLAIARDIMRLHDGELVLASREGAGAEFVATFSEAGR